MKTYVQRLIAFVVATLAIFFPVFGFAPRLYGWFCRQRFRQLYQRLRVIASSLRSRLTPREAETLEAELADIERATMTVQMRHSDLYFMLRYHLDQARARLIEASSDIAMTQMTENKDPMNRKPTDSG